MSVTKLFFLSILVLSASDTAAVYAPSFITPCPPYAKECIVESIQSIIPQFVKGIPKLGVKTLDPLLIKHTDVKLHGDVRTELTNGIVKGLKKCKVELADFDVEKDTLDLQLLCNISIRGKYKAYGKVLIVWLNGDGYAKIKANDVRIMAKIQFQDEVRDSILFYEAKDLQVTHRYDGKIYSQITNLFNGNNKISDFILKFLNDNWRQVAEEFGDPIIKKITEFVFDVIKKFFAAVPKSELFVDWEDK